MVTDWYAQAYSLVHFLMRRFPGDLFYSLCDGLRQGVPVEEAFGAPTARPSRTRLRWRDAGGRARATDSRIVS